MIEFFKITLFIPLYNLLLFITNTMPHGDLGLAIIILTILIKIVIFPLYAKSIYTQIKLKSVESKLKEIKEKYKKDLNEQSRKIMEVYRQEKINPLSGFLVLFIQLPVIITLFYVFKDSFVLRPDLIYEFTPTPEKISTNFFGLVDLTLNHNYIFAVLAGSAQYLQTKLSLPPRKRKDENKSANPKSFSEDLARSMDLQMRYMMPVLMVFVAFSFPVAISFYWITSSLFSAIYETFLIKKLRLKLENSQVKNQIPVFKGSN
ncbi:MAG: hypothetical protein COV08_03690 [Candidatus Vogelbacteria bacterium CG10_big_fil_rev_8_21_14_0_10_49_38]|uniref:Membrane insertase YidC/Oxa/ALB C-terminal domain-containing protein n=1 Tax=Candidatus Vogelbacteria bacterium CG10_big_fil_rev_8_21_14_0_10_49_38 TaxID=1975043 RepID=A0A2H0RGU7_9BACT|nr:MAG: hypothetical protein BK006_03680 [bacterium CG10_49_38]PIR45738.1 MAG: hypothetical protein COV08_03690 [Candidatus Vogelbacteria bacterium CG10_big_fil_rev_8_21_14_0_10_49_38]